MAETFPTDFFISKFKEEVGEKELVPWDCSEGNFEEFELDSNTSNGWDVNDMFKQNEQTYGVISNFDDELSSYTVPLKNEDSIDYKEFVAKAAKIASEIESNELSMSLLDIDGDDGEEEKYASVVRSPPECISNILEKKSHDSFEKVRMNNNRINFLYHSDYSNKHDIRNISKKHDITIGKTIECRQKLSQKESGERNVKPRNNSEIRINISESSMVTETESPNNSEKLCRKEYKQLSQNKGYDLFCEQRHLTAPDFFPISKSPFHVPHSRHFSFDGGDLKYLNSKLNPNAKPFIPRSESNIFCSQTTQVSESLSEVKSSPSSSLKSQKLSRFMTELKVNIPGDNPSLDEIPHGSIPLLRQVSSHTPPAIYPSKWNARLHSQPVIQLPRPQSSPSYGTPVTHEMHTVPLGLKIHGRRVSVCTCYPVSCVQSFHPHHALRP